VKKTTQRRKSRAPRETKSDHSGRRKFRWFLLLLFGLGSYFAGDKVVLWFGNLGAKDEIIQGVEVVSAEGFSEDESIPVAGSLPQYEQDKVSPVAVKSSTGSVFSEGEPPVIVGNVPEGWRVETSNEIKVKFGPHKVPVGDDITFVVPVYTLVPSENVDGVYIIEPGRTRGGDDEGGTLSSILTRLDGEAGAISEALGSLSKALSMLPVPEIEERGVADGADGDGRVEGVRYKTSVSGR